MINNNQRRPFELNVATGIDTRREIHAETSREAAFEHPWREEKAKAIRAP
jgi:hypothetical protein